MSNAGNRVPIVARPAQVRSIDCLRARLPLRESVAPYVSSVCGVNFSPVRTFCRVALTNGAIGWGEGPVAAEARLRILGRTAADELWRDENGQGLQMALFDAVARSEDRSAAELLGKGERRPVPLSWAAFAMPGNLWAREAELAASEGFRDIKFKAWPWFDFRGQCETLFGELPAGMRVAFDFNSWLVERGGVARLEAAPFLAEVDARPEARFFEEPIPTSNENAYRRLRRRLSTQLLLHAGELELSDAIAGGVCDGYVVSGGASRILYDALLLTSADVPFLLQLRGTHLLAAYLLQIASTLSHCTLPSVTLHTLFADSSIHEPLPVRDGRAEAPAGPGLGVTVDEDLIERFRVQPDEQPPAGAEPAEAALSIDGAVVRVYRKGSDPRADFHAGRWPHFRPGAALTPR